MTSLFSTIFGGIVILGVLVFVHELGHFCVAKLSGVKVLKFSLGFGPKLFSRVFGETEYMVCAIPLGGYVLMLGEGGGEEGETAELAPEEAHRSFAGKPVGVRTAIIAAGPTMNLLLPFVVLPIAFLLGVSIPAYLDGPPQAGYVVSGSPAAAAGLQAGDRIFAINGAPVSTWDSANTTLVSHVGAPVRLDVRRNGGEAALTLADGGVDGLTALGILPPQPAVIGALAPGMPAAAAGLKAGERIVAIDGQPLASWYELKPLIAAGGEKARTFTVATGGAERQVVITPKTSNGEFLIGISPEQQSVEKRYALVPAIRAGWERAADLIRLTFVFIGKLFSGHVSTDNIGGPISVVQIAGQAVQTDLSSVLLVLAFLSIQLGILNLLPVPVLDGGHLLFNLVEAIIRRPVPLRAREIAQQIGLGLLLLLMVLAFYNDISRLVTGG